MDIHEFLELKHVSYEAIPHQPTFDAQRLAQAVQESGHQVAKTVLLKSSQGYLLAVVPASHIVDLPGLRALLRSEDLELASEVEVDEVFYDCETGAIPPFGSYYSLQTLVDEALSECEQIVIEGNTHQEAIRIRFEDYFELEKPVVLRLTAPKSFE